LLTDSAADTPTGDLSVRTDHLSSHDRVETTTWLAAHPRIHHVFIPTRACGLHLQQGWWRLFRRAACAGQRVADPPESAHATRIAPKQLNARAKPWVWGRPPKPPRYRRRLFCYHI
jgi:hypothetical protein